MSTEVVEHARALEAEFAWFKRVLDARIRLHCAQPCDVRRIQDLKPPDLSNHTGAYACFVNQLECSFAERLLLILTLSSYVCPQVLDVFLSKNALLERPFTEFGGFVGQHGGFWPTAETALFLLAGDQLGERLAHYELFDSEHPFFHQHLLWLEAPQGGEAFPSGKLVMAPEFVDRFTLGRVRSPAFGPNFPAKVLESRHSWDDLVLDRYVFSQLDELRAWMACGERLLRDWGLDRKLGSGYRCLFHGPPGTGKSMTAGLLGKHAGRVVYRVDLSMVVSKYVGETEKNLESVFRHTEHEDCILFFDEADALFGKRTGVSSAHDRYANQEVAYLLQRIESFAGIIILASNLKTNLDDAFLRRFQSVVHFPMPQPAERLRIWQHSFSEASELESTIRLEDIAEKYELAGGSILNVVRYCSLLALQRGSREILLSDLQDGIRRELHKEGRTP